MLVCGATTSVPVLAGVLAGLAEGAVVVFAGEVCLVDGFTTSPFFETLILGRVNAAPATTEDSMPPLGIPRLVCCNADSSALVVSGEGLVSVGAFGLVAPPVVSSVLLL